MQFLKYMLATITGIVVVSLLFFFIFFGIMASVISSTKEKPVNVKPKSVLVLKFDKPIVDRGSNNPMDNFNFATFKPDQKFGLDDIIENIKKAKSDSSIRGIYMELSSLPSGIATIEEVRNALADFKSSKKFIITYGEELTQGAYYLASISDKIYLNPQGLVDFKGLNAEIMFFKGSLEKLGIEPQVIRHGKFKSAIEPFVLDKMSPENREQTLTYMKSIWDHIVKGISDQRKITVEDLNFYADSMVLKNANAALDVKMVDGLKYKDEILAELKTVTGTDADKDIEFIGLGKYKRAPDPRERKFSKDKIAVIYASGQIDMGKGDNENIGSESLSETIRQARLDKNVKAVVLRVNSPGGSALASEVIWREVILTKKVKPVIASMGDVAASGGYYISCAADTIVANPNTITGSIGVFGLMFNGQKFINDKLGVTIDVVKTNTHSDIGSVFRRLSTSEKNVIQASVEEIYDVFITHVGEGRKLTKAQVDSIGQGRVWSGENALKINLVDVLGGLDKAIEIAARKAGLTDYRITSLPEQKEPFEQIMEQISGDNEVSIMKSQLGESYKYYKGFQKILKMQGIQARLPYDVEIN